MGLVLAGTARTGIGRGPSPNCGRTSTTTSVSSRNRPIGLAGRSRPLALATSKPLALATSKPLALARRRLLAFARRRPLALVRRRLLAFARRRQLALARSKPLELATSKLVMSRRRLYWIS